MVKLKQVAEKNIALKYLINQLEIKSSVGKDHLLEKEFSRSSKILENEFVKISKIINIISDTKNQNHISKLQSKISGIRNIRNTIINLASNSTLDDVELFEIKHLALLSEEIAEIIDALGISFINFPESKEIIKILDPDGQGIPHFYIYSSYSKKLAELRKEFTMHQNVDNTELAEKYRLLCTEEEDYIRKNLSEKLCPYSEILGTILDEIAETDVLIAKSLLAVKLNFCKPEISNNLSEFKGIFNPYVKTLLEDQNKSFQPVDINLISGPVLITGANMSGKTVLLKTIELTQYLFQFGFYVPAKQAFIEPVDKIQTSFDDKSEMLSGLSSFAAEIIKVNKIILSAKKGENTLVLIDELARTTNPEEGKAIVMSCLEILSENKIKSLITTHYSGIISNCRKLRVKGLKVKESNTDITIDNINDFIDYSLTETDDEQVPTEALNIAEILGVDKEFLKLAKDKLK